MGKRIGNRETANVKELPIFQIHKRPCAARIFCPLPTAFLQKKGPSKGPLLFQLQPRLLPANG